MFKKLYIVTFLLFTTFFLSPAQAEVRPLPAEQAFVFSAYLEKPSHLVVEWHIAPGYMLYRDKLHFIADPAKALTSSQIHWPASQEQEDPGHGKIRVYRGHLQINLPLTASAQKGLTVKVQYQGCSENGFCYAPMKKVVQVTYPFAAESLKQAPLLTVSEPAPLELKSETLSEPTLLKDQDAAKAFLGSHAWIVTLLCFLGLGVLLAFTPCSLPMIPILSSIILGRKNRKPWEAFYYSLAYVFGMSLTYAVAGLLVAWAGSSIQAYFQSPAVIVSLSLLFVLLSLSAFEVFELRLPAAWRKQIVGWEQKQKNGTLVGDFLLGCLSSLIVSPCVTAPLVGVLAYVAESGNLFLGFAALFALGLGMGLPLLLIGFSAGKYLPTSGPWMKVLQKGFAFLLLGMAIWMLSRILPSGVTLFLWASFLILIEVSLFFSEGLSGMKKGLAYLVGTICTLYALVLFFGVAMNYESPFYPFEKKLAQQNRANNLDFIKLTNLAQLDALLSQAKREGRPVMLDFYADWCPSCRALESAVLSEKEVQASLRHFLLLRADVTENNAFDQALLKRYRVIAPPTFLFFNPKGQEVMEKRIIGEVDRQFFLERVKAI